MSQTTLGNQAAAQLPGKISYEEFLKTDFENPHVEWVDGKAVAMPPISDAHQDLSLFLGGLLRAFAEEKHLGIVRQDPFQMKTGPNLPGRAPDLLFLSTAHMKQFKRTHARGPADMVVEIISPESGGRDRGQKFHEYEEGGVPEYWLIDPQRKQAEFYLLSAKRIYKLAPLDAGGIFHSKAMPGLWIDPDWFWARPLPSMMSILRKWGLAK